MSETALVRHMIAKVSLDTDGVTKGSAQAKREVAALAANFKKLEDTKSSLGAVSA